MLFLIVNTLTGIAGKINELIASETSEGAIKDRLLDLQLKLEMGQISTDEYDKLEEDFLAQLEKTRPQTSDK